MVRAFKLHGFFSRYVDNVYSALGDAVPSNYITMFMFLTIIIIITFSLAMFLLMKKKEKPRTLYIVLSVYYLLFLGALIVYFVLFKSLESTSLTIRNAMIIRDLTLVIILPQFVFLILSCIRGVGFDIKKFNFSKDLKELEINEDDNEEFEFILGVDSYKYFRFLRRRVREFKYYILENKFMFTILSGLTIIILVIMLIMNFTVYNKTYNKNQKFVANNLTMQVNNSYLTNIDYKGEQIAKGKYFLIVNMTFTNNSGQSTVLDLSSYELKTKNGKVLPTLSRNSHFVDFGAGYAKERFENGKSSTYILIYELTEKQLAKKFELNIIDEVVYSAGTMNAKTKNVTLKPKTYYDSETVGTYKLEEPVTMYESILENSYIVLNSFEFKNKFTYKYEACVRYDCRDVTDVVSANFAKNQTLLILNGNLEIDENSAFAKNLKTSLSFYDAFVQIRYDDKISSVINVTPNSLTDKFILQVNKEAANAKNVDLIITVRNKKYIIDLK